MNQFNEYLVEASINSEEVKRGIIDFLNSVVTANNGNPVNISFGKKLIRNVSAAKPINIPSSGGVQPYSDVELILANGSTVRLGLRTLTGKSFDSRTIPALQGGLKTLERMFPTIRREYLGSLLNYLSNTIGLSHGQIVPQCYGRLTGKMKEAVLMGNSNVGGEADYIMAIQRVSFRYKKMRMPFMEVVPGTYGATVRVSTMDARLFDKAEVLKNNDVYVYHKAMKGNTLYLFDDVVDAYNNPIIIGPPLNTKKSTLTLKDFPQKVIAKANVGKKGNVFDIDPSDTKYFKLELIDKTKARLPEPESNEEEPERSFRSRDRYLDRGRKSAESEYYPEIVERKNNVEEIVKKYKIALNVLERKNLTSDSQEDLEAAILGIMKTEDDADIKKYAMLPPHRLSQILNRRYHSKLQPLIKYED